MILNPRSRNRAVLDLHTSLFTLWLLVCGAAAYAQPVLTPPPAVVTTPPALQEFRTAETGENQPPEPGWNILPLAAHLLEWGPVNLHPHVTYSVSYADGILSSPFHPENTIINQISPGILFTLGTHWTLDYTPSLLWYSNHHFTDSVTHNLALNGWTTYEDWTFGLNQTYRSFSQPVVQTGTQVDQESIGTALNASYLFNSKVSADFGLNQDFESVQQFQSYRQRSTMDWLNYQFWPRVAAGLGVGGGYVAVDSGADMTFEQFQGRINWQATAKTSFILHGGLEYRQFLSGGVRPLLNPVFGAALRSQVLPKTTVSLSADRAVSASYFVNQTSEATSVSLDVAQGLSTKLTLSLGGGYGTISYTASATGIAALGGYDYAFFRAFLTYAIIQRGNVSLTYQFNDDRSNVPGFSFTSHQVGLQLSYSF